MNNVELNHHIMLYINYQGEKIKICVTKYDTISMVAYYLTTRLVGSLGRHYSCSILMNKKVVPYEMTVEDLDLDSNSNLYFAMEAFHVGQ